MPVYTPQFAPLVVLAFLGTGFGVVLCLLLALAGILRKSRQLVLGGLAVAAGLAITYSVVLLGLSVFSSDTELPLGGWKYFCEIDCHIAYTVEGVQEARSVGPEMQPVSTRGKFVIVRLKSWFDPSTISAHRGDAPLVPNERVILLQDGAGKTYKESPKAEALLAAADIHSTRLRTALRPGESYLSYLVFEIPYESTQLRLLLTSAESPDAAIWGDENSPFHKKAYFRLPGSNPAPTPHLP